MKKTIILILFAAMLSMLATEDVYAQAGKLMRSGMKSIPKRSASYGRRSISRVKPLTPHTLPHLSHQHIGKKGWSTGPVPRISPERWRFKFVAPLCNIDTGHHTADSLIYRNIPDSSFYHAVEDIKEGGRQLRAD